MCNQLVQEFRCGCTKGGPVQRCLLSFFPSTPCDGVSITTTELDEEYRGPFFPPQDEDRMCLGHRCLEARVIDSLRGESFADALLDVWEREREERERERVEIRGMMEWEREEVERWEAGERERVRREEEREREEEAEPEPEPEWQRQERDGNAIEGGGERQRAEGEKGSRWQEWLEGRERVAPKREGNEMKWGKK